MTPKSLIRNIKWRFTKIFLNQRLQDWDKVKRINQSFKDGNVIPLDKYSKDAPKKPCNKKRVVCIYDGMTKNGGLADRLRGIISVYGLCKELEIDFKLIFNSPFKLSNFLIPNKVNWEIQDTELNYNTSITDICYIVTLLGTEFETNKQRQWFKKEFCKKYKEYHVRTNAQFSYYEDFACLFDELFKFSPKLKTSIDKQKAILSDNYISTSFRFMNLLDDFNEISGVNTVLSNAEKETLIAKSIEQLEFLHNKYPAMRILVNSDSKTFLHETKKLDYVYVIPGNITHIDGDNNCNEYENYEKTFLDFFMIANAEKIYLLRTGQMYNSGYPFAASKIYNKPFEKIEF